MNAHKKLTETKGERNERTAGKKLKRGTPIFSWFPLEQERPEGSSKNERDKNPNRKDVMIVFQGKVHTVEKVDKANNLEMS